MKNNPSFLRLAIEKKSFIRKSRDLTYLINQISNIRQPVGGLIDGLRREYVCMYGWMDGWMEGWMDVCIYVSMYLCMYVCMYLCMYVYMYVCMYVCM